MKRITKSSATAALASLALALGPVSLHAAQITVPSKEYPTIQAGVDAAKPGGTVLVLPGTYVIGDQGEFSTAVDIPAGKDGLQLKAAGAPGSVKIVGPGDMQCISIEADNALVEGFDISGFWKGVVSGAAATRITGNTIHDLQSLPNSTATAIELDTALRCEVDHNTIYGCVWGITLYGASAAGPNWQTRIHHNREEGDAASWYGVFLWQAPGCKVDHNECDNNGTYWGIYLASSPGCMVEHNEADRNAAQGILLGNSPDCTVVGNEANDNGSDGISVGGSCGSTFAFNVAKGNGECDLADYDIPPTCDTFLDNEADTACPSLSLWDVRTPPER